MRKFFYLLLVLPLMSLISCDTKNNPEWKEEYKVAQFYVVQFVPEAMGYIPNVMLVPDAKANYRMRRLQNGGTCKEFFIGHTPFARVDTVQRWYQADWKWGLIISKNHVAIPLRWSDVTQPDNVYVRSDFDIAATGIIEKYGTVSRSDIDELLHITPAPAATTPGPWGRTSGGISTDHLAPVYLSRYYSAKDIPDVIASDGNWKYTKEDFIAERLRQDSLQAVYKERLATLIYSGMVNSVIKNIQ